MDNIILFPKPHKLKVNEGSFLLSDNTIISIPSNSKRLNAALCLLSQEIYNALGFYPEISNNFKEKKHISLNIKEEMYQKYTLTINQNHIEITGSELSLLYGISTLRQLIRINKNNIPALEIEDEPELPTRGIMLDVTRGKVYTLETLKNIANRASFYKINQIQLYVEHSFAFSFAEEMWQGRTPLTAEEIKEFDEYCESLGIELVPCLATFGHLYELLEIEKFKHLREVAIEDYKKAYFINRMRHHTLDVTNSESFELVKKMIDEFAPLFKSNKFNICCDETFDLGLGRSAKLAEEKGVGRIYVDFLNKIIDYTRKYKPEIQFWGDIIVGHPELIEDIRPGCVFLNWGYSPDITDEKTRIFHDAGVRQFLCPGTSGWNKLFNNLEGAFMNINKSVDFALKYNAEGVLNTDWGDYGHINPISTSIPAIAYCAGLSWNYTGENTNEYDQAISMLEYGTPEMIHLMKEAGKAPKISWANMVRWYYNDKGEMTPELIEKYGTGLDRLKVSPGELNDRIAKLHKIKEKINLLKPDVYSFVREDLDEILTAIEGLIATQKWGQAVLNGTKDTNAALLIEEFITDLSKEWRKRYKETDLNYLIEILSYAANYIR